MTMELFEEMFAPLKAKWDTHFTADVRTQIFYIVNKSPRDEFKKLIDKLIWHKPFSPPPIEEFLTFSRSFSVKRDPLKGTYCDYCGYIGTVSAEGKNGQIFAFRCVCPNGKDNPATIKVDGYRIAHWPLWNEVRTSGYWTHIKPVNRTLQVFTDEERKENFKFMWDVLSKRVGPDEIKQRIELMERAIEIAQESS